MTEISYVKLSEIADIIDCPHSSPTWRDKGIPVIRNYNLVDGIIDTSTLSYVDEDDYLDRTKRVVPSEGDILFSREAPIGNVGIIPKGLKCCQGQRIVLIRPKKSKVWPDYLLVALQSDYAKAQFNAVSKTGSIVSNFNIGDLKDLLLPIMDIESQKRIAEVIININSKILIDNQLINQYKAMARATYEQWFLQFNIPGLSFDLIDSEELLRKVPVGWEVSQVKKVLTTQLGGTPNTETKEYWNGNICWLNSGEVANFPVVDSELTITQAGVENSAAKVLPRNTTLVSITGNIRSSITGIDTSANQSVVGILQNDRLHTSYIFQFVNDMLAKFTKVSTGNCQQHINKNTIDDSFILVPPANVLEKYYKLVDEMFERIIVLGHEIKTLKKLRGELLPLLLNGQVSVG